MTVEFDDTGFKRKIAIIKRAFENTRPMYAEIGRHVRDYIRQTITLQGRGRAWRPLSTWTKRRTGRYKALITLRPFFQYEASQAQAIIYFDPPSNDWGIRGHHEGSVSPAVSGKLMVVPGRGGGVLAAFHSRKAVVIPARRIWPTNQQGNELIRPIIERWYDEAIRRSK